MERDEVEQAVAMLVRLPRHDALMDWLKEQRAG